jgi:hypothetical protein
VPSDNDGDADGDGGIDELSENIEEKIKDRRQRIESNQ